MLIATVAARLGRAARSPAGRPATRTSWPFRRSRPAPAPALWLEPRWSDDPQAEQRRRAVPLRPAASARATTGSPPCSPLPAISRILTKSSRRPTPSSRGSGIAPDDLDALAALEAELSQWKDARSAIKDLVDVVRIAIKLEEGRPRGGRRGIEKPDARRRPRHVRPGAPGAESRNLRRCDLGGAEAGHQTMRCGHTVRAAGCSWCGRLYRIESAGRGRASRDEALTGQRRPAGERRFGRSHPQIGWCGSRRAWHS